MFRVWHLDLGHWQCADAEGLLRKPLAGLILQIPGRPNPDSSFRLQASRTSTTTDTLNLRTSDSPAFYSALPNLAACTHQTVLRLAAEPPCIESCSFVTPALRSLGQGLYPTNYRSCIVHSGEPSQASAGLHDPLLSSLPRGFSKPFQMIQWVYILLQMISAQMATGKYRNR